MKIERVRVDVVPKELSPYGEPELKIEVRMLGGKIFSSTTIFPTDDFSSNFDRMMERAGREIKYHIDKGEASR